MDQYEGDDLSQTHAELMAIKRKEAIELGRELGMELGKESYKRDFALTLLGEDFDVEYVAKLAKLSVAEVEKLEEMMVKITQTDH